VRDPSQSGGTQIILKEMKMYLPTEAIVRLAKEPPFRIFARLLLKSLPISSATRALWEISDYPPIYWGW